MKILVELDTKELLKSLRRKILGICGVIFIGTSELKKFLKELLAKLPERIFQGTSERTPNGTPGETSSVFSGEEISGGTSWQTFEGTPGKLLEQFVAEIRGIYKETSIRTSGGILRGSSGGIPRRTSRRNP